MDGICMERKIKRSTLFYKHKNGGLKNVEVFSKVVSLQYSWMKRLVDDNFCQ